MKHWTPADWIKHTRQVDKSPSKTFTAALGTALLAKATNRFVDALSLKAGSTHKSYSARSLAKDVLVPECKRRRINIRTTGAEPLNNQPFLRAHAISTELKVPPGTREHLEYLCDALKQADFLEGAAALNALAAFIRVRMDIVPIQRDWKADVEVTLWEAGRKLREFHNEHSEGGKVGQALVCAVLDGFFEDVRTRKINDPSRKVPGDVGIWRNSVLVIAGEVKQRAFHEHEIRQFVDRLREAGVGHGFIAALDQGSITIEWEALFRELYDRHGVFMRAYFGVDEILRDAAYFTMRSDAHQHITDLPQQAYRRLVDLEVSIECLEAIKGAFGGSRGGR